ncbi:MAG: ZIP family metal transporter [Candidatus Pacebacteria bacterium]|nr:ZIP family metal transporter [Candidatus Paceibacterota bacterium]MCF7856851.1 ZIP family metal transporter [Candidatus Paceibacterota bacterium]
MFNALIGAFGISLLSLTGVFFFGKNPRLTLLHRFILPIAVGIFLGIVFFELIPETMDASRTWGPVTIMAGFLGFYLLSHFLDTFHHHHVDDHDACTHNSGRMILIGDAVHNMSDGIVIASAFMLSPTVGVLTTLGIALHEVPQEIIEYGILLQSGYSRKKAAFYNFLSATTVIVGVLITYLFMSSLGEWVFVLTGVAAGNLLYIATADLIPELKHSHRDHFFKTFAATFFATLLIALLSIYIHAVDEHVEEPPYSQN